MTKAGRELEAYRAAMGEEAAQRQSELARRTCWRCMRVIAVTTDHAPTCKTWQWLPRG